MKASVFDKKFDSGDDISKYLDLGKAKRTKHNTRRINLDIPQWALEQIDLAASRMGVTRQSIIKLWLVEKLDSVSKSGTIFK